MKDNILNDKQREVLYITQEECAEVTQAISKIFRFGFDARYPVDGSSNREKLTEEVGDLVAMIRLLIDFDVINMDDLEQAAEDKMKKLKRWSNLYDD
jgi:NTP pyrophosphatase (non-canonical NTP hydrolase)